MKYEITQGQYVDFLNHLDRDSQDFLTRTNLASGVTSVTNNYVMVVSGGASSPTYRNGIYCPSSISATDPITFSCNLNQSNAENQNDDGHNIACNYLEWNDIAAYLDWAALRPMTELEYEKACRGPQSAVPGEYAWGSTSSIRPSGINNGGTPGETVNGYPTGQHANVSCKQSGSIPMPVYGGNPLRVGAFATSSTTRSQSGATYWGIMEMSGNVQEWIVTAGDSNGRTFTGLHGDGYLKTSSYPGESNVSNWPGRYGTGAGVRGGNWYDTQSSSNLTISSRYNAGNHNAPQSTTTIQVTGGRGMRTAP
jgi:formylglycine-generating enzyme required for sulfatase activity